MSDFNDRREQELLAEKLQKAFDDASKLAGDDHSYVAYLWFCTLGGMIVNNEGADVLKKYVEEIVEKNASP